MVSFYQSYLPAECQEGHNAAVYPTAVFTVSNQNQPGTSLTGTYYLEYYDFPIMIPETDYAAGDTFKITVTIAWNGWPVQDFTVKLYSK